MSSHALVRKCGLRCYSCVVQVDAVTAEEQKVIAFSDKTDIGRVMLNEDTR